MNPAVAEWVSKAEGDFVTAGRELLAMILKFDANYEFLKADLETLEDYSVRFRYPGHFAEKDEAQSAYAATEAVRKFVRQKLGLK